MCTDRSKMYECPNCSAGLKFDIARQAMLCEACDSVFSPWDVRGKNAEESEGFEVTVFTCPQCAGEVVADTNEAMTFCLYCGASTVLDSRFETIERPAKIIPFKKTKSDCMEAYKRAVGKSFFSDKQVRKTTKVDSFRGIYMPYWVYNAHCDQDVSFSADSTTSTRKGNYIYTKVFDVSGHVSADYDGCAHDASSTFPDRLSEAVSPYDLTEAVPFTPAFMAGFYADASDLDDDVYKKAAFEEVRDDIAAKLVNSANMKGLKRETKMVKPKITPDLSDTELVMLPVWFMSARYTDKSGQDRITYSVVNGQTGNLAGELPVSTGKVFAGALVLAVALFGLLSLITYNFMPSTMSWITMGVAVVAALCYKSQTKNILKIEKHQDDIGYMQAVSEEDAEETYDEDGNAVLPKPDEKPKKEKEKTPKSVYGVLAVVDIIYTVLIHLADVHFDMYYYAGAAASLILVLFTQFAMIGRLNLLATRPLPQFKRKGGDDDVR